MKFAALTLVAASAASLTGCVTLSQADPAYGPGYYDAPVAASPAYVNPGYPAPTYQAPVYGAPAYPAPGYQPQPDYRPQGRPYAENANAFGFLEASVRRMHDVINQYGPDAYGILRREIRDMEDAINVAQRVYREGARGPRLTNAYANVQRTATVIDNHLRTAGAHAPVQAAWDDVRSAINRTSSAFARD